MACCVIAAADEGGRGGAIRTPKELWATFDPRKGPLEIETIRRWTEDGSKLQEFYFTGETYEGEKVRIYAIYGAPATADKAKKLPGVLHIHGGGQTASGHWVKFWNKRGYAALTFNWGGEWPGRERCALWGKLKHCNHRDSGGKVNAVNPTPRESSWYHWTLVSRRALTVLERRAEVDPKRLGIFGISMGGTIVWTFAGSDPRVKAACAIYGAGWNSYPASKYAKDPKADDPDTQTWRRTMAPEAYPPLIKCPVLFLSGTNDFHGKMDRAYDTLGALKTEWRAAFTPFYNHHVAEAEGRNLPLWMDWHLRGGAAFPKTPEAKVSLGPDGAPMLTVRPGLSQRIKRVEAFYAVENCDPKNRNWRSAAVRKKGDAWVAQLPIMTATKRLFAFAQVYYEAGMCLASNFEAVIPADLGEARATDKPSLLIGDFANGLDDFHTTSTGTDPCVFYKGLSRAKGPGGRFGVRTFGWTPLVTRRPGDPKWRGPAGAKLAFEVYCPEPVTVEISLTGGQFNPGARSYQATLPVKAAEGWQKISLAAGKFKHKKGGVMKDWTRIDTLQVAFADRPKRRPVFTNFRWIPARK